MLVDGHLIGVAWTYPVIYTSRINPLLLWPIVGISAIDAPTYEIDVTAYLPVLLGEAKGWKIRVVRHDPEPEDRIGSTWIAIGRVFVWTNPDPSWVTAGTINHMLSPEPRFEVETCSRGSLLPRPVPTPPLVCQHSLSLPGVAGPGAVCAAGVDGVVCP